ncbi:DUF4189 domain-containing protein [Luteibacter sp. 22Crub2.1]|uniref:DUF4189 domain-containing protein n=1 Tax=Luteibacter sp. 22Crub2.1 TaxID=1283288 RepID=UPI0009A5BD39|nr:DUF4189 domain-containing protein [Luteibacter sp. 22Crub2.1]SKB91295.1 protein of unknown function [Luteibacter sp. 22Crub2.1]
MTSPLRLLSAALALLVPVMALGATPPAAPAEVTAAAPPGTTLLAFSSSGEQPNADAVAVFQTAPDKDNVRHRTLVIFGKKDDKFVPDVSNDKVIACSLCSQFHDDQFYPDGVKVTPGHIHIDQSDAGEKPSETALDFVRKKDGWHVTKATRRTVVAGYGADTFADLPLPPSGLAKDMDAKWSVPVFYNTVLFNRRNGKFMFMHQNNTPDAVWAAAKGDCNKEDCDVLVQQQDGCISLVRDSTGRPFAAGTPNPKDKKAALSKAMDACSAAGGTMCKEANTDCSTGIF